MNTTLGEHLKELRNARDLSLRELAKLIDRSPSMLSEIESGNRYPSNDMLASLARALRTTVEDLKKYDSRPKKKEVNQLVMNNPDLGWVFRSVVDKAKDGVPAEELLEWINKINTPSTQSESKQNAVKEDNRE